MYTNKFLFTGAVAGVSACSALSSLQANEKKSKPNILFIFADDQTYEAIEEELNL